MNLFFRPGEATLDEMIQSTKLGLYITRFWYTRTVHPRDAVVTGMTRDGTFVVHDGETDNPFPNGSPEAEEFNDEHVLLGSETLFRTSLGLTRDFEGPWEAQLFYEHLSHGQILASGRNQGLDEVGIRFGYQFGE